MLYRTNRLDSTLNFTSSALLRVQRNVLTKFIKMTSVNTPKQDREMILRLANFNKNESQTPGEPTALARLQRFMKYPSTASFPFGLGPKNIPAHKSLQRLVDMCINISDIKQQQKTLSGRIPALVAAPADAETLLGPDPIRAQERAVHKLIELVDGPYQLQAKSNLMQPILGTVDHKIRDASWSDLPLYAGSYIFGGEGHQETNFPLPHDTMRHLDGAKHITTGNNLYGSGPLYTLAHVDPKAPHRINVLVKGLSDAVKIWVVFGDSLDAKEYKRLRKILDEAAKGDSAHYIEVILDLIKGARVGSVYVFVQGPGDAMLQNTGALHFVLTICSRTKKSTPTAKKLWMSLGAAIETYEVRSILFTSTSKP